MKFNKFLTPVQGLVVIAVLNTACGKYPEGPGFSLRSKAGRLAGEWEVQEIDGDDDYDITLEFTRDGDFTIEESFSIYGYSYTSEIEGEWEWIDDKEGIELDPDNGNNLEFEILRLTNSEMILEDEGGDDWELEKQ